MAVVASEVAVVASVVALVFGAVVTCSVDTFCAVVVIRSALHMNTVNKRCMDITIQWPLFLGLFCTKIKEYVQHSLYKATTNI